MSVFNIQLLLGIMNEVAPVIVVKGVVTGATSPVSRSECLSVKASCVLGELLHIHSVIHCTLFLALYVVSVSVL